MKELKAELFFEIGNPSRDGGLGQAERRRGAGEGAAACNGDDVGEPGSTGR
jgi:hypothetical protein